MASYAVVKISGKQYRVEAGKELLVDKLGQSEGEVNFDQVLLFVEDGTAKIGTPVVSDVQVSAKVLGQEKGKKIDVVKFKAKARYRRHTGFRPSFTRILIEKIGSTSAKKAKTEPKSKRKIASK